MQNVISYAFRRIVRTGTLRIAYASGETETFGDGSGERVAVRFADSGAERAIAWDPAMKIGEMFMDGRLTVEEGSVYDLIALLKRNGLRRAGLPHIGATALGRMAAARVKKLVRSENARGNVAHHYDLEAGLFDLFLDEDRQYSCAYFEHPDDSLEAAQLAKKRHIAAKLLLRPGDRVLDIGCGWGGMAIYLAKVADVRVIGITLSEEQLAVARRRAAEQGLSDRVSFELLDYRAVEGPFDRIVSVGMFEHVGAENFAAFFRKASALLKPQNGVMLLHSIGRTRPLPLNPPWVEKYIFPGGYIPALSEVMPGAEQAGFLVKDIEILSMHYAWTLRHWRERFLANWDRALAIYDERFCRMWEFYLATAEAGFRYDRMFVFQLQLLAWHQDAAPFTRNYMAETEAALKQRDLVS